MSFRPEKIENENKLNAYDLKIGAWLEVSGEDAFEYLQSQFSNDLSNMDGGEVVYGLWLNAKGKVLADSFALKLSESKFALFSYECSSLGLKELLEKNIVADEVFIEDLTSAFRRLAFLDEGVCKLEKLSGLALENRQFHSSVEGVFVIRGRNSKSPNYDVILKKNLTEFAGIPLDQVILLGPETLSLKRIESGMPLVPFDIGPDDLPQEGGLEEVSVSLNKGCYLGQEVMNRMESMGKVRRSLFRVRLSKRVEHLPFEITVKGKPIGFVRSQILDSSSSVLALAMLKLSFLDNCLNDEFESDNLGLIRLVR